MYFEQGHILSNVLMSLSLLEALWEDFVGQEYEVFFDIYISTFRVKMDLMDQLDQLVSKETR